MTPQETAALLDRLDDYGHHIDRLAQLVSDLEAQSRRLESELRDVGYRADEAQRAADRAASSSLRGW